MNDRTLVLGAGGFVGRHLVRALAARGEDVIAVTRQPFDENHPNIEVIVAEPTEQQHFDSLIRESRKVIHAASSSTPGSSAGSPLDELRTNLSSTLGLLAALQNNPDTQLVYLSSGGSLYKPQSNVPATETAEISPRSYHGAGKVAAEHFIIALCNQYGNSCTILRPANIYGPGQVERPGFGIVPAAFGKLLRDETLTVWGDGSTVRDYIYIDDFISLCLAACAAPSIDGTAIVNAASGIGISLNDLLSRIESISGRHLRRTYTDQRVVDASSIIIDVADARKRYGWTPTTPLDEGLRQTWNWFNTIQH